MISQRSFLSVMLPLAILTGGLASAQAVAPEAPTIPRNLDVPGNALVATGPAPEIDLLGSGRDSRPARSLQPSESAYQVRPPRRTLGGSA